MTREDKMQLWQERLQHHKDSELTIAAWCELHQIAQSQFYYWQKKLTTPSTEPESVIVPVPTLSSPMALVVETPGGYRISVHDASAIALLPQVMKCLQ
ncbi:IS66 family insertion sequence element accessory protein TnpA [Salinivibrio socompensis]|uniref:IS66 family insertion sequence element accessory protein TnpA n=1 Tax=Salinivibrio socompensis TaxID=1510206 RepID=UPI0004710A85|nr:hypothetical protein [Salinivibrio socompensis]